MKYTNKLGLPDTIVKAVTNDTYSRGEAAISITGLVGPPRIRVLKNKFDDELEEDVADRIYSLLGQSVHAILERAALKGVEGLFEKRFFMDVLGWKISGQMDAIYENGLVQDYKLLSYYKVSDGVPYEFEAQLNCYAALLRHNNVKVEKLELVCLFRDWSKTKARNNELMPQQQGLKLPVMLWPAKEALAFLEERVKLHQEAEKELPLCSDEDRWKREDKWAVCPKRGARAIKLHPSENAAKEHAASIKGAVVEPRFGEPVRCLSYCSVSKFCAQFQNEKKEKK